MTAIAECHHEFRGLFSRSSKKMEKAFRYFYSTSLKQKQIENEINIEHRSYSSSLSTLNETNIFNFGDFAIQLVLKSFAVWGQNRENKFCEYFYL